MTNVYVWWGIAAVVLILSAAAIGSNVRSSNLGILIDSRGRFSLSQFQIVLWTILVLSLLSGTFIARLLGGVDNPLNITIPNELLIVMGISVGSTAVSGAIKASKDLRQVTIKGKGEASKFSQVFLVEEGTEAETIDVTKYQNFWLTLIAVVAYIATAVTYISTKTTIAELNSLPGFSDTLLTLLGISHAGYIAGKLPDRK